MSFIKEPVSIFHIYKGNFHRDRIQHGFQFFYFQMPACHHDLSAIGFSLARCSLLQDLLCPLPALWFNRQTDIIILRILIDSDPLFFCKMNCTVRKQNIGFLVDHFLCPCHGTLHTLFPRFILSLCFRKAG